MRKYIIYIDVSGLSPTVVKKYMKDVLTDLKEKGIIGKNDIACVMSSSGPTRIETLPISFFEKLSIYIDKFFGKINKINDGS